MLLSVSRYIPCPGDSKSSTLVSYVLITSFRTVSLTTLSALTSSSMFCLPADLCCLVRDSKRAFQMLKSSSCFLSTLKSLRSIDSSTDSGVSLDSHESIDCTTAEVGYSKQADAPDVDKFRTAPRVSLLVGEPSKFKKEQRTRSGLPSRNFSRRVCSAYDMSSHDKHKPVETSTFSPPLMPDQLQRALQNLDSAPKHTPGQIFQN